VRRAKPKTWRGAADLSLGRCSRPREPFQLVPPFLHSRLPFALIFSTLAAPSIHSLGKVTCVYLFPFLPIFHNHSFFYYLNLFFFSLTRTVGILVCTHSLMPLHSADASARLTSHISVESRACCELSQGTQIPISYT